MQFLDARRLTGPSLLSDAPAAVLDVACSLEEAERLQPAWRAGVERMLCELDWPESTFSAVLLEGGVSLAFTAPVDSLYAASEINEWAFAAAAAELGGEEHPDFDASLATIRANWQAERNGALLGLQRAAEAQNVSFLWDDDDVSVGLGVHSETWPARSLPSPSDLDWQRYTDIPFGLITGTNGKTTCVRLAQHILRFGGRRVGVSSTDWISVDGEIIDRGDWSGPGGARAILRRRDADVAVLETARGGLLRRGLGVERADAALITNISADHLGDFGSRSLDELLNIKWIVSRAVSHSGRLILNADDELLVARATGYDGEICWFSLDSANPVVREHVDRGGAAWALQNGQLTCFAGGNETPVCRDSDIPITLGGAARHNTANALAAAALTESLGASLEDIRGGLESMSQEENPGRCNVYDIAKRKVLVDFAHNPRAMQALFDMAGALPARRRVLCFGQAGDRPDGLIEQMTRDAWNIGIDRFHISELAQYHRGRGHGEVFAVIRDALLSLGARPEQIKHFETESESLAAAFDWADSGDLVIMLALGGAAPIREQLRQMAATTEKE